jgi:DNA-directed RNA polymerase specialized sigma24 family protein
VALIFDELDRDWRRLRSDRRAEARLSDICALAGVERLEDLETAVHNAARPRADAVLAALVRRALAGEGLAARVLLQLLLPGARRVARRWWALGDQDERAAAAVSAVWGRIQRYPLERRPSRIAANILMDADSDLRRSLRRRDRATPVDLSLREDTSAADAPHPAVELAEALVDAVDAGVIGHDDAELIAASRIAGMSLRRIAERRGMSLRTVQWHRQRAEAHLARSASVA